MSVVWSTNVPSTRQRWRRLATRSQSRHSRRTVPTKIELAERLGYERAWVFDSPALFADPWMTLARAADRTTSIRLGCR
jgi:alkanesulfonate monooxygenase SsuD/methylene tetrahydromethanopterin reductase-like flavin-dependent oxidoreductase (luciferase family)